VDTADSPAAVRPLEADLSLRPPESQAGRAWRRFRRHRLALVGLVFMIVLVVLALGAPVIASSPPNLMRLGQGNRPPSAQHWLGTDSTGRDVFSRLLHAGQVSLSVGLVAVTIRVLIGTLLGGIAGYYRGAVDAAIMRLSDTIMALPGLIVIIILVDLLGASIWNVMAAIGLLGWPSVCRLVRGQFLSLREVDYVMAARCMGVRDRRIIFRHILPNTIAPLTVAATFGVAGAILTEASLSFLGLGVRAPTPSWGNMLTNAQQLTTLESHPWLWIPPGLLVALSVLAINFIGDGLRDALDPRMDLR